MAGAGVVTLAALALVTLSAGEPALAPGLAKPARAFARRTGRFASLSGAWSGEYAYGGGLHMSPVAFNALIEEVGEALSGNIDEPNTFADPAAPRLFAALTGTRKGGDVAFTKRYDGVGGATHAIEYRGTVNAEFTRVDGAWTTNAKPPGSFFMERSGADVEASVARAASAKGDA